MTKSTKNRRSGLFYGLLFLGPIVFCSLIGQSVEFADPRIDAPLFFSLYGLIVSAFAGSLIYAIDQTGNDQLIGILPVGVVGLGLVLLSLMKEDLAILEAAGPVIVPGICYAWVCVVRKR